MIEIPSIIRIERGWDYATHPKEFDIVTSDETLQFILIFEFVVAALTSGILVVNRILVIPYDEICNVFL